MEGTKQDTTETSLSFDAVTDPVAEELQTALFNLAHDQAFAHAASNRERDLYITNAQELWMADDSRYGIEVQIKGRLFRLVIEPRGPIGVGDR